MADFVELDESFDQDEIFLPGESELIELISTLSNEYSDEKNFNRQRYRLSKNSVKSIWRIYYALIWNERRLENVL